MISREIQDLMDQAEKNVSITESLDFGFRALTSQVSSLQQQVASLKGDGVITEAEKQQIVNTTNDLAASFSKLQADIPANTEAAPASADTSTTGTKSEVVSTDTNTSGSAGTDPNAPAS